MALVDVTNQLMPDGPLQLAFKLALARGDSLDQRTVATMFCYIIGAHFAEEYRFEPQLGPVTEETVRTQARALLNNTKLFNSEDPDDTKLAIDYIWKVTRNLVTQYWKNAPVYEGHLANSSDCGNEPQASEDATNLECK